MSKMASTLGSSEVFFGKDASNQLFIKFFDPAYTRAETIVFEPKTRNVHAVLHENLHFLGQIPEELGASYKHNGSIILSSDYTNRSLTAHISVSKN